MFFLLAGFLSVSASGYSQQITLKGSNMPFSSVIDAIRKQSGYTVFATKKLLNSAKPVTINVMNMPLTQFMETITENQPVTYEIEDKTISLSSAPLPPATPLQVSPNLPQQTISGTVRHAETKQPIENVTVKLKGGNVGTLTNAKGQYQLVLPATDGKQIIVFSYIGMKTQELAYQKQGTLDIDLEPSEEGMGEVVVTGIYQRDRLATSGSSTRYGIEELKLIGNQNVLQSLKTLDPSFAIIDNNQFGSDPNRMPDIEIRGKSSVIGLTDQYNANPNQPLFILDGFESTLAIIADLSMDRVESITLLKDASATAIYGSKAANGV
ncbi:MAG: SusC/RagA family TonB-linked outer membrane protein, partial [Pedobacter sp.]